MVAAAAAYKGVAMKKILAALAVLSTLALAGCGDDAISQKSLGWNGKKMQSVCFDGKAYAILYAGFGAGLTQIWENGPNGPRPMMCGGKEGGEEHE